MADCERGLGRPEKALEMAQGPEAKELDKGTQIELRIVAAGARRDLGHAGLTGDQFQFLTKPLHFSLDRFNWEIRARQDLIV